MRTQRSSILGGREKKATIYKKGELMSGGLLQFRGTKLILLKRLDSQVSESSPHGAVQKAKQPS